MCKIKGYFVTVDRKRQKGQNSGMKAYMDQKYTLEEYFELERQSEEKWEFWDGNVWNMSGASFAHEDIVSNLLRTLGNRLPPGCRASGSNVKVKVPTYAPYRYPDVTIVCGKREFEVIGGLQVLLNPQAIIEVLSPSTEAFDRGAKFTYYKSIPSLTDYLLISASEPYVTCYLKRSENEWVQTEAQGIGASIMLPTFDVDLLLSEVYLDVDFPERKIRTPEDDLLDR
jgi:Uma2 family endonuclease